MLMQISSHRPGQEPRLACHLRQHERRSPGRCMRTSISAPVAAPSGAELRRLERRSRQGGTGLQAIDLQGIWRLDQVWPKDSERPASFSAALLRGLAARLEIHLEQGGLVLRNAVRLGALELSFRGPGRLVGARPLLQFHFETLALTLAGRSLLRRSLPVPPPRRMPFFALIARDPQGWLAARGRGGGLALWRLEPAGTDQSSPASSGRQSLGAVAGPAFRCQIACASTGTGDASDQSGRSGGLPPAYPGPALLFVPGP